MSTVLLVGRARDSGSGSPTRPVRTGRGPVRTSRWRRSTPAWWTRAATARACSSAASSTWLGPQVWRSDDLGATWQETPNGAIRFPEDTDAKLERVWQLAPGRRAGVVYAGTEPGAIFRSTDRGETFELVRGLWDHPHRPEWGAGFGGQAFHTILPHPNDPQSVIAAHLDRRRLPHRRRRGSWEPANKGVKAEFMPEERHYPEFGQCVHKVARAPRPTPSGSTCRTTAASTAPTTPAYVDRTSPRAARRVRLPDGGPPARARHRLHLPDQRCRRALAGRRPGPGVALAATPATRGGARRGSLPDDYFVAVMRDAMCADGHDPAGLYFGGRNGAVWASADEGETWREVVRDLPDVMMVRAARI